MLDGIKKSRHPEEAQSAVSKDALHAVRVPSLTSTKLGAELDAALAAIGGFEPRPLIAVGVSGGPDSLALMILADRWARERDGQAWGLIVDHRLRPESAAEAETVGRWLAGRGIPHAVLAWAGEKPATGIQEAARDARYRLLGDWCAAHGCLHLLTAHHRDDQAETYLIRRRAGSGVDGLAGMSALRELPQLRLVRPLLGVAKTRLAAFLDAERQPYVQDPSNRNPAFERARLRLALGAAAASLPRLVYGEGVGPAPRAWEGEGQVTAEILTEIRGHAALRIAREKELAALLARAVSLHPAGFAVVEPGPIASAGELGDRALDRVVAVLGGGRYPMRGERLRRLREAFADPPMRPRTLGGNRFVAWRGRVLVLREPARTASPVLLAPGMSMVWDHRFFATLPINAPGPVTVGALGTAGIVFLGRDAIAPDNPLPRLVYPMLPAIWDAERLIAVPHLSWYRVTAQCLPELVFKPAIPLFGAGFTVV
jgi:tRNA(Ile)-lysidine synthase